MQSLGWARHGLATFTDWYDDLAELDKVDCALVSARYWADQPDDNDRQRQKQAEFLIWKRLDWSLVKSIGVLNDQVKQKVEAVLMQYPDPSDVAACFGAATS